MKRGDLDFFKRWFTDYVGSFSSDNEEDRRNLSLKEEHTFNVCKNILLVAKGLSPGENELLLAETAALFHDLGRFEQYTRYKTFRDSISVNHAALGATVLSDNRVLDVIPERERTCVLQAVKFHNVFSVPDIRDKEALLLVKLIRDADKLDIWRIFLEYYDLPPEERASAVGLGLPDRPGYSGEILSCVFDGRVASLSDLRTLNDFKLLKLSWIYDLNFDASLRLALERNYLGRLMEMLPQQGEIAKVPAVLKSYIHQRLKEVSFV